MSVEKEAFLYIDSAYEAGRDFARVQIAGAKRGEGIGWWKYLPVLEDLAGWKDEVPLPGEAFLARERACEEVGTVEECFIHFDLGYRDECTSAVLGL